MLTKQTQSLLFRILLCLLFLLSIKAPLRAKADMGMVSTAMIFTAASCSALLVLSGKSLVIKAQRKAMKSRFAKHPVVTSFFDLAEQENSEILAHANLSNLDEMFSEKDIRAGYHLGRQAGVAYNKALLELETYSPASFLGAFRTNSFHERLQLSSRPWPLFIEVNPNLAPNLPPGTGIYILPNERGNVEKVFLGIPSKSIWHRNSPLDTTYITRQSIEELINKFSNNLEFNFKLRTISHSGTTMLGPVSTRGFLIEVDIIPDRFDISVAQHLIDLLKEVNITINPKK